MGIGSSSHGNNRNKHRSRMENMDPKEHREVTRALNASFMEMDADGNVIPKTPQAAIMAATSYLAAHPPPEGDPKRAMHKSALTDSDLSELRSTKMLLRSRRRRKKTRHDRSPTPSSEEEEEHDLPRRKKS